MLAGKTAAEIAGLAGMNDAAGLAARHALWVLNPFSLTGIDYSAPNADGALNLYDVDAQRNGLTAQYLADRANFLERKLWFCTEDRNPVDPFATYNPEQPPSFINESTSAFFLDSASGYRIRLGALFPSTHIYAFGSESADVLIGQSLDDHLYGGGGADFLTGGLGDADYLEGGTGVDSYRFATGDGADTLLDADGKGILIRSGAALTLGMKSASDVWQFGGTTYTRNGTSLEITFADTAIDKITILDFDFAAAQSKGFLGIRLVEGRAALQLPQTTRDIQGDREILVTTANVPAILVDLVNPDGTPGGQEWQPQVQPHWTQLEVLETYLDSNNNPVTYDVRYKQFDDLENLVRTSAPQAGFADSFVDSSGADHIVTEGGNDTVTASGGGNDVIETGEGEDIAWAGAGNDWIDGGAANDTLLGEAGDDFVTGGGHGDIVQGGEGSDWLEGEAGADIVAGGEGEDAIFGGTGRDANGQAYGLAFLVAAGQTASATAVQGELLDGGAGKDLIVGASTADLIAAGLDEDLVLGGAGDDNIYGDASIPTASLDWFVERDQSTVNGARVYEVIRSFDISFSNEPAAGKADVIYGGAGEDWIFGGAGDDYIDGGDSADNANVTDDVLFGEAGSDILIGGSGKDFLSGDSSLSDELELSGDDFLSGGAGDDELIGGHGDDILDGGAGDDILSGGIGNDILWGGAGTDAMAGGAGKDTYVFNRGDGVEVVQDVPDASTAADASVLALGDGIARTQVKFRLGTLMVDLGEGDAIHFDGFNPDDPLATPLLDSIQFSDGDSMTYQDVLDQGFDLDGTEGDDYIKGTAVTDRIDAKAGNDIIEAGAGNDIIITGAGADIVFGNAGDDRIVAGDGDLIIDLEGASTLDLTDYAGLTQANLEITQYRALDGDIYLNFHIRDDMNLGVTPATGGLSVQYGEIGNFASVTVSNGAEGTVELAYEELMTQYTGHGLIYSGSAAAELLMGTQYDDTFLGGAGADTIRAGAGDDKFDGGAGDDLLEGGAGNDTYLLGYNRGRDTVVEDGTAEPNASHTILLDAGIPSSLVYARQAGGDLEVRLRATGDALILKDFYLQPQSWQEGWQVRDGNGTLTDLAAYVPVIPPQAATWLQEEEQAYRARREQVAWVCSVLHIGTEEARV